MGRRVLGRLGLDLDSLPERSQLSYEVFLPEASGRSYYALLADAQLHRVGRISRSWSAAQELDWLAARLRLVPDPRLSWWHSTWLKAEQVSGSGHFVELSTAGKRRFLEVLATPGDYPSLTLDALVAAFVIEAQLS